MTIPFDLKLALAGHEVETADGSAVLQLEHFPRLNIIVAQIEGKPGVWTFCVDGSPEHEIDRLRLVLKSTAELAAAQYVDMFQYDDRFDMDDIEVAFKAGYYAAQATQGRINNGQR